MPVLNELVAYYLQGMNHGKYGREDAETKVAALQQAIESINKLGWIAKQFQRNREEIRKLDLKLKQGIIGSPMEVPCEKLGLDRELLNTLQGAFNPQEVE